MKSLDMFEQILKDVIPLSSFNIKKYLEIEENNEIFLEHVTPTILFLILEKYIDLLLKCDNLVKLFKLINIEKISDFEHYTLNYGSDPSTFLNSINSFKNTDFKLDNPNIKFYLIKWTFLSFFEDLFYLTNCSLPLNIPQYFDYLISIYRQPVISDEIHYPEINKLSIDIEIKFEKNKKILFENNISLFIESSTLEGIYVACYYYTKLFDIYSCSQYKFCLYFGNKEINFIKYVKNKSLLREKEFCNDHTKYTAIISPLGKIVNYENETFIEGFNLISSIVENTPFKLEITNMTDNFPVEKVEYVKT